jgi:TolA-binding protein
MNIWQFKPFSIIVSSLLILLSGCYPQSDVQDLYDRQAALASKQADLEAKIDKLSNDLEAGLSQINQNIDKIESSQQKLALDFQAMKMNNAITERRIEQTETRRTTKNSKSAQAKPKTPANTPEFIYSRAAASYEDGRYEDAILEYQKLIDTYPKDKRIPEAYLKQGLSLINLGRKQEAKYFLNTLIDKYPNTEEARTAREKLKTI